jgi:hypothetical protein
MANTSSNGKKVEKQTAVKQTAVKANSSTTSKLSGSKNKKEAYILEYNIIAIAQKEEDYSGATIMEWFDSGKEVDAIASPYDYKKIKNVFEVVWQGEYNDLITKEVIEEAIEQIKNWTTDYDAYFKSDSYLLLKDSSGIVVEKFNFEKDCWEV